MPASAGEVAIYRTAVPATRAAENFTVRLRLHLKVDNAGGVSGMEEVRILWQRR